MSRLLGYLMLALVTLAMWFCGLSCVTSTSRMIFAFARDRGMPFSEQLAAVSRTSRTPAFAVWLAALLALALPCFISALALLFPAKVDFERLYPLENRFERAAERTGNDIMA